MFEKQKMDQAIANLYKNFDFSQHKIRNALGVGAERVSRIVENYEKEKKVPQSLKQGRPSKSTTDILTEIESRTISDRTVSCRSLGNQLGLSSSTVWRYRQMLNFNYKPPKMKQLLTQKQKSQRLLFAESVINSGINTDLIAFSDECRFCQRNDNTWKWYRRNDDTDDVFQQKEKVNKSVMIFAAIGIGFKSNLVIVDGSVDDVEYRRIFQESKICDMLNKKYGDGRFYYMQDGAPAHFSESSRIFLQKN